MLIPGFPAGGAQQDPVKIKRQVEPTQGSAPADKAEASPVERRQRDSGRWPERRRRRRRLMSKQPTSEEREFDLPTKGLLIDIEA